MLKLKDEANSLSDANNPKSVIWTGQAPAQRFANNIRSLTVDTGRRNPGAIGIQFNANNTGTLREVTIRSEVGEGVVGLDMSRENEIDPCFIKNISIASFHTGIRTGSEILASGQAADSTAKILSQSS